MVNCIRRWILPICLLGLVGFQARGHSREVTTKGLVYYNSQNVSQEEFREVLDNYKRLKIKVMVLPVIGCQPDKFSSEVDSCKINFSDSIQLAKWAMDEKIQVDFLPIVKTLKGEWRGDFVPTDVERWFTTYTTWIVSVAKVAQEIGIRDFHAGSEFKDLYDYEESWRKVLQEVRKVFTGRVLVTTNWDKLELSYWDASDAISFSYYFPLADTDTPTDAQMLARQLQTKKKLLALSAKWKKPLYIAELGYPSIVTAARMPWDFPGVAEPPLDLDLQSRCFASFIQTWRNTPNLHHVGIWSTSVPKNPYSKYTYEILLKPVEDTLLPFFMDRRTKQSHLVSNEVSTRH